MDFYPVGSYPEEAAVWFALALAAKSREESAIPRRHRDMLEDITDPAAMLQRMPRYRLSATDALVATLKSLLKASGDR